MPHAVLDRPLCRRDHACIATCPSAILAPDADGYPHTLPDRETFCIACGHCVAVCNSGAFSLDVMPSSACAPLDSAGDLSPDQVSAFLRRRRSIRRYRNLPIPPEVLTGLLEAARYAPTAKNGQPVHYLIVNTPAELTRLLHLVVTWMRETGALPPVLAAWNAGRDGILRGAPALVIAHAPTTGFCPQIDCTIALTQLDAVAPAFGLGSCWAGLFMMAVGGHAPLRQALGLPEGHQAYGALMLGYPKVQYRRVPVRVAPQVTWR